MEQPVEIQQNKTKSPQAGARRTLAYLLWLSQLSISEGKSAEKIVALLQRPSIFNSKGLQEAFMAKLSVFGVLTNVQMLIHTLFHGTHVGTDFAGNKYYKAKGRTGTRRERRWVIYTGKAEASLVPPEWHGWLHHQTDTLPQENGRHRKSWQKPHQPNLTGTKEAYLPPGHALRGGRRDAATGDYKPWQPPE
jgi:NADH:ubiquinone oxidoreductase subunit